MYIWSEESNYTDILLSLLIYHLSSTAASQRNPDASYACISFAEPSFLRVFFDLPNIQATAVATDNCCNKLWKHSNTDRFETRWLKGQLDGHLSGLHARWTISVNPQNNSWAAAALSAATGEALGFSGNVALTCSTWCLLLRLKLLYLNSLFVFACPKSDCSVEQVKI